MKTMNELFVPYNIAILLRDKKFDCVALAVWVDTGTLELETGGIWQHEISSKAVVKAPLWQQAIEWLEDKYKIEFSFSVGYTENEKLWRSYNILILEGGPLKSDVIFCEERRYYETKKQILLEAIEKSIELI